MPFENAENQTESIQLSSLALHFSSTHNCIAPPILGESWVGSRTTKLQSYVSRLSYLYSGQIHVPAARRELAADERGALPEPALGLLRRHLPRHELGQELLL